MTAMSSVIRMQIVISGMFMTAMPSVIRMQIVISRYVYDSNILSH